MLFFPTMLWQQKQFFKWKENIFFVNIFGKPVSKCAASFRLLCTPVRKRRKVSLNLDNLRWFYLLFSTNNVLLLVFHRELSFICLLLHQSAPFSRNFVKDATHSLVLISFNPKKYFFCFKNTCFGPFLSCISRLPLSGRTTILRPEIATGWPNWTQKTISFSLFPPLKRMRSCTNVDASSKVWHTSTCFPKRCDRILISDNDVIKTYLKTHLKEL